MKSRRDRNPCVKPYRMSVGLVMAVVLIFAPLSRSFSAQECSMLGASPSQEKSCQGCCATMKCCMDTKQQENSQPVPAAPNHRGDSVAHDFLAVTAKFAVILYLLPEGREHDFGLRTAFAAFASPSLARLCVRLI